MSNRQIRTMASMALLLLGVMAPNIVWAKHPSMVLTPLEQAVRLSNVANQEVVGKLFPPAVETITPKPSYQRNYRSAWRHAPSDRAGLAEKIGTQGAERYASKQGWIKLLDSQGRSIPQGPDSIYWDRNSGLVRVVEAKGGSSQPKWTYGSRQGTNRNTLRSAEFALKFAKTWPEKLQAARIIKVAQHNQLETRVVRTAHVLGKPEPPQLEGRNTDNVKKEAVRLERDLVRKRPNLAPVFREAAMAHKVDRLKYLATTKGMATLGLASTVFLGWDAYQQAQNAWGMFQDPALRGTILPYMQTGIAVGRGAQAAATLELSSATQLGLLRQAGLQGFGQAASQRFLPIAVGVEGLRAGVASYEYASGRISQREFYHRSTGPAIFAVFTVGGAIVGGGIPGASLGAVLAVPVQFAGDWMLNRYYQEFDERQLRLVDAAVERFYGLEARTHLNPSEI